MSNIILFEDVQQLSTSQQRAEERLDMSERFEEIISTEEGAEALLRCIIGDYGIKDTVLSLFPFLPDNEQARIIEKAFPAV